MWNKDDQTFWVWCGSIIVATLLSAAIPPHDFFASFVGDRIQILYREEMKC